uniref:Uncharacterized protein n=1 Tax=Anopheles culicifacies TaxID=139723 RepID=A0A182LW80_9DIPT
MHIFFIFLSPNATSTTTSNIWPALPVGAVFTGMDDMVFTTPVFWGGLLLIPISALLFDISWKASLSKILSWRRRNSVAPLAAWHQNSISITELHM